MLLPLLFSLQLASTQVCADGVTQVPAIQCCPRYVFFDSGKAEIRREWEPILDEAAKAGVGKRLLVVGHSDTSGSPSVNRRMARSRAETVAAALVARGVPASSIDVRSAGEEQLLIPTAEGVREIQNRRVAIIAQP